MGDALLDLSEARLWALIDERALPGADVAEVDRRIWELYGETWAVMFTDLSGFSRRVAEFGITHFLQTVREHQRLLAPVIRDFGGILLKVEADSLLVLFRRAEGALRAAIRMQHVLEQANVGRPPETRILLCVGIGYGELLRIGDRDAYGREVNAASKLGEDVARAGEILLTRGARDAAGDLADCSYEPLDREVAGSPENFRLLY